MTHDDPPNTPPNAPPSGANEPLGETTNEAVDSAATATAATAMTAATMGRSAIGGFAPHAGETDTVDDVGGAPLGDALVPRAPRDVQARRHPMAIVATWVVDLVVGIAVGAPFAAAVRVAYGAAPGKDAALWEPGALPLAQLVAHAHDVAAPLASHVGVVYATSVVVGVFVLAALIGALGLRTAAGTTPRLRDLAPRVLGAFWPTCVLGVGAMITIAVALGLAWWAGALTHAALAGRLAEPDAARAGLAVSAVVALGAAVVGVVHDLARAAVVIRGAGALAAVDGALRAFLRAPLLAVAWGWRAALSAALVVAGALVADRLGGRAGAALVALAVVHQGIALARVALRASWLARAVRGVTPD